MRSAPTRKSPDISIDCISEKEEGYTEVVRGKKAKKQSNASNDNQKKNTGIVHNVTLLVPKVVQALLTKNDPLINLMRLRGVKPTILSNTLLLLKLHESTPVSTCLLVQTDLLSVVSFAL